MNDVGNSESFGALGVIKVPRAARCGHLSHFEAVGLLMLHFWMISRTVSLGVFSGVFRVGMLSRLVSVSW